MKLIFKKGCADLICEIYYLRILNINNVNIIITIKQILHLIPALYLYKFIILNLPLNPALVFNFLKSFAHISKEKVYKTNYDLILIKIKIQI